ncbi:hypothetical protein KP509_35G003800 [Ceratopteris richardii]|nr:hypothetical protein KP509_35G003800 [Ceratopteris richardii]
MYIQCGAFEDASVLFAYSSRGCAATWAKIMGLHIHPFSALQLFNQMCTEGVIPVKPVVISFISSFSDSLYVPEVKRLQARVQYSDLWSDVVIRTALIGAYSICNHFDALKQLFGCISERDTVLWVVIIRAYLQAGRNEDALQLFHQMTMEGALPNEFVYACALAGCNRSSELRHGQEIHCHISRSEFRSDSVTCNALVTMYGKCGKLEDAIFAFNDSDDQDKVSWNAVVGACAHHDQGKAASSYLWQMQERGFLPNDLTLMSALDACANQPALADGKRLHALLTGMGLKINVNVSNALINMYGRSGSILQARWVFDGILDRNIITWTSMVAAYAFHGLADDALDVVSIMFQEGIFPNSITFVNILTACGHCGLVMKGYEYFGLMRNNHVIPTIEHYNCLLDLLARAGLLDEGEMLLKLLPIESTVALWTALLGGCRIHFDVERADFVASKALHFESHESGPYVLLHNMWTVASQGPQGVSCKGAQDVPCTEIHYSDLCY